MTIYVDNGESVKIYPVKNKVAKAVMTLLESDEELVWSETHTGYGVMLVNKIKSEVDEMGEKMKFRETFEQFAKVYGFKDDKEVYTNGSDLIPIFRVKQWLEHDSGSVFDKIRAEIESLYKDALNAMRMYSENDELQNYYYGLNDGLKDSRDIIDKYKGESEE